MRIRTLSVVLGVLLLVIFGTLASARSHKTPKYRIIDLGHLPGGLASDHSGQIAGSDIFSYQNGAIFAPRAFLYDDDQLVDLGTLGGAASAAFGINVHGHVVGRARRV